MMLTFRPLLCLVSVVALAGHSFGLPTESETTLRLPLRRAQSTHHHPRSRVELHRFGGGYLVPITLGQQHMEVFIDTGSPLLVVLREDYKPKASHSSTDLGYQKSYQYGDGSGGHVHLFKDDLSIAESIKVKQVSVGRIVESHEQAHLTHGILGLAHWEPEEYNKTELNVLDSMTKQGLLPQRDFTLDLNLHGGSLIFNDPNVNDFTYHKTRMQQGVHLIDASGFGMQSGALMDSGCTDMLLPKEDFFKFAAYYKLRIHRNLTDPMLAYQVQGDCDSDPGVTFSFSQGQELAIPKEVFWSNGRTESGECLSKVVGVGKENLSGFWVLGDGFMQAVRINYDYRGGRIGLAPKA